MQDPAPPITPPPPRSSGEMRKEAREQGGFADASLGPTSGREASCSRWECLPPPLPHPPARSHLYLNPLQDPPPRGHASFLSGTAAVSDGQPQRYSGWGCTSGTPQGGPRPLCRLPGSCPPLRLPCRSIRVQPPERSQ